MSTGFSSVNVVRYSTRPARVFWREVKIGDDRVLRIARIDLAVGDASDFFRTVGSRIVNA